MLNSTIQISLKRLFDLITTYVSSSIRTLLNAVMANIFNLMPRYVPNECVITLLPTPNINQRCN